LIFDEPATIVGASVTWSIGSTIAPRRGSAAASRRTASVASPSTGPTPRPSSSARGPSVTSQPGPALGHALQQRRELDERVVADARHRGVPRDAVGVEAEAEDALLADAHGEDAAVLVRDDGAAALVEEEVAAHEVGVVLADPLRALLAAGLLVDDADDEQVAAGRPPPGLREPDRRDGLGRRLRLHVERAATPDAAVGHVARPRAVRPLRRRRQHGVHVGEQPEHRAVGRPRRRATRLGRSGVRPTRSTSKPASRSRPASHSCASRSSPGGLTVSKRMSRCRTCVASIACAS
jgi:hypothetical protein